MLLALAAVFASDTSLAQAPYGRAGCGLGSIIIKDNGIMQIFAATTNGTSGNQTFGITSGTSNCVEDGVVTANREQEAFVEENMAYLRRDMATGGGEYLAAFGDLLGCEETVGPALGTFAKDHYDTVFATDHTNRRTAREVLYTFKAQMSIDPQLSGSCARL
jgi:hypothetical protein